MTIDVNCPSGWTLASIPELVGPEGLFVDGDWVESKDQDPGGGVRLIQLADIGDGCFNDRSSRFLTSSKATELRCTFMDNGDVLIARMPDPLGRACIFPGDSTNCVTVVDVCIVRAPMVSHRWLMWAINAPQFRTLVASEQRGSTRKRISRSSLGMLTLPVPPRREQDKIVAAIEQHLSDIDAGVASLERVLANLKRYRASVLAAACEGRLVPTEAELAAKEGRAYEPAEVLLRRILKERRARWEADHLAKMKAKGQEPRDDRWKEKYEEPKRVEAGAALPEGWVWSTLGQLTTLITSGSRGWGDRYADEGPLFIRAQDIKFDCLALTTAAHVNLDGAEEGMRTRVTRGDLLVTITGANVTKTARVDIDLAEAYVSQHVGLARPTLTETSTYLHSWIISPSQGRRRLEQLAYGAGKPGLNLDNLRELFVALPPLAEQKRIVAEVDRLLSLTDETEQVIRNQLSRAERLRQSVLKRAFEGKLVPQDPNDEPASLLLERIKNQQAKAPSKKAGTKKIKP